MRSDLSPGGIVWVFNVVVVLTNGNNDADEDNEEEDDDLSTMSSWCC